MPKAAMPNYGEMPGQSEYAGQQMMNQFYQQAQAAGSTIYHAVDKCLATVPLRLPLRRQDRTDAAGALQNLDTSLPVEELMKHMNYEMAVGTVIPGRENTAERPWDRWQLKARQRSSGLPSNIPDRTIWFRRQQR